MSQKTFKIGDEVTIVSGEFIKQLAEWRDNKALITRTEKTEGKGWVLIKSGNGYTNGYKIKDLKLTKANKMMETNKNFIKKHNKKKDFITTILIQNFFLITRDNNKQ